MATGGEESNALSGKRPWLDYAIVGWHALAGIVSVTLGFAASSIVLTGFGLANVVQTAITGLILRRFHLQARGRVGKEELVVERKFLFILGVGFFLLSLYILHESGSKLFYHEKPQSTWSGLVFSVLAFLAVTAFSVLRLGSVQALRNKMLRAAARETAIGIYPSLILFLGLLLNIQRGWWWADPVATLFMLPFILRQGWKAIEDSKESALPRPTTKVI